jgi:hypothetical protein
VDDDWDQERESVALVCLENVEEVVVFEEAHSAISNLEVKSRDALDQSLKDLGNVGLKFLHFAGLQDLNEFADEHNFLGGVGEGPVLDEPIEEEQTQRWVFGQEQHGASHEVLVEEVAGLHFVERDDHILEEDDVFFSEGHGESGDDTGQNVEQFRCSVELEGLVDETVEAVVDGLADHLSSGHQLGIEAVQDVLQVLSFSGLFGVEEFQKFLNEGRSDVHLEGFHICAIVDDELKEELVDGLEMRPGGIGERFFLSKSSDYFFHADTFSGKSLLFEDW